MIILNIENKEIAAPFKPTQHIGALPH